VSYQIVVADLSPLDVKQPECIYVPLLPFLLNKDQRDR
jgi:hypothetical protein